MAVLDFWLTATLSISPHTFPFKLPVFLCVDVFLQQYKAGIFFLSTLKFYLLTDWYIW